MIGELLTGVPIFSRSSQGTASRCCVMINPVTWKKGCHWSTMSGRGMTGAWSSERRMFIIPLPVHVSSWSPQHRYLWPGGNATGPAPIMALQSAIAYCYLFLYVHIYTKCSYQIFWNVIISKGGSRALEKLCKTVKELVEPLNLQCKISSKRSGPISNFAI